MPPSARQRLLAVGVGLLALGAVGWRLFGLYSVPSRWDQFLQPTRDFLEAAARRDSAALSRLVLSPATVVSTLQAVSQSPASFSALGPLELMKGRRTGDTTRVVFINGGCRNHMVTFTFVGTGAGARVKEFSPPCSGR